MKFTRSILAIAALSFSHTALAGIPVDAEMTCPIGGEIFKTTSTMSCTTMGRTMSMQAVTSCDFITHLAQCPGNKLPMYKEFSDVDIAELKVFMATPEYKDAAKGSRFYLAALIERTLTSRDTATEFYVLQEGFWHTPSQSYKNPAYVAAYHKAAAAAFTRKDFDGKPFWQGAEAMVYLAGGDVKMAKKNISQMETDDADSKDYLASYKAALTYCLSHPQDEKLCLPTTSLREHDKDTSGD